MNKLERQFTEDEISDLTSEGTICDMGGNTLFTVVHEEVVSRDREKNSNDVEYVIEDHTTRKFYIAELLDSDWWKQGEYNAKQPWYEVTPKTVTTIEYVRV